MAHEIESNDGLVLADCGAWHGLGLTVKGAPNPFAALRLANLDWTVEESATLIGVNNPGEPNEFRVSTDTHKLLTRSDDHTVLGVVGKDYTPVQNQALAELAWALRSSTDVGVEIETAGSIRGGKRVWFLIRSQSIEVGTRGDLVQPYLLLANGHDGGQALRAVPTNVRVVCANTYRAAMGQSKGTIAFRHTPGITERVDELARTINDWQHTVTKGLAFANSLAAKPMSSAAIKSLWIEVIERLDGKIVAEPVTGWEIRSKERAISGLAHMAQVFDKEAQQFGATAWVAANAATNWIEHERSQYAVRTKDAGVRKYAAADGATADDVELVFDILAKV